MRSGRGRAIRNRWGKVGEIVGAAIALALAFVFAFAQPAHARPPHHPHFPKLHIQPLPRPGVRHLGMPNAQYQRGPILHESERITYFISDVTIGNDGTMTVHETIRVVANGGIIRHGIYRDIPIIGRDRDGARRRLRIDIVKVQRDGGDTPYHFDMLSHHWRIRIGDRNTNLTRGPHTYDIVYRTNRQVAFYADADEVYWNATGVWPFDIEQSVTSIQWPAGAHLGAFAAFSGEPGSAVSHVVVEHPSDTRIVFRATAPLRDGWQMTVRSETAKGAVARPDAFDAVAAFVYDNPDVGAVLVGLILLTAYYYIVWSYVGRDPFAGPVAPLYAPPPGMTPAGMRYVMRMGYDGKAFAATLISLGVKGHIQVDEEPGFLQRTFSLLRLSSGERLPTLERAVLGALFQDGREIRLTQENQPSIARAIIVLKNNLHGEFDRVFFVANREWFYLGLIIVVLSAFAAAALTGTLEDTFMIFQMSSFFGLIGGQFGVRAWRHWVALFARHGSRLLELWQALRWTLATLPFAFGILYAMFYASDGIMPETIFGLMAQGFVAYFFYHLLKAPTAAGAKLRVQIEGFRMFLLLTEEERLKLAYPAGLTAEDFEKYLPFAVALDAETGWTRRFESDLTLAATARLEEGNRGSFRWYSGNAWSPSDFDFTEELSDALSTSVTRSSLARFHAGGTRLGAGGSAGGGSGGGSGGGW